MINALFNHLWQSTLFVVATAALATALRRNRAGVRYGLWLAGSVKFLVPFAWLILLGSQLNWFRPAAIPATTGASTVPAMSVAIDQFAQPFSDGVPASIPTSSSDSAWLPIVLAGIWLCGFAAVAAMRLRGWRRVRAAVRASSPLETMALDDGWLVPVRSSPALLEPGVVGWRRPVLLLPAGIERYLTAAQLHAVVSHELCHVRRRDNLTAAIHMLVEATFWFHPLVWWIGARLVDERERACDEYVLRVCGEPQAYAEGILTVCKRYVESPVACVPGVTGSDLKRRITHIMTNRIGLRLNITRRIGLAAAAVAAFAIPVVAGAMTAPLRVHASSQRANAAFDVASVKPCPMDKSFPGEHIDVSSHRAYYECFTVESLLNVAYAQDGNFTLNAEPERNVRGGPDWIRSERYTVEATTAATVRSFGPMLRTLFDERFHVRSHKAVEETPMYALTVAKNGLKIQPMADGDCVEDDASVAAAPAPKSGGKPPCGMVAGRKRGTVRTWELNNATFGDLAAVLDTDRRVLDQTGITKRFIIRLEYDLDEMTTTGVTVFRALEEQLGLKLVSTKGPHEVVVIDHIERPVSDAEVRQTASASAKATADGAGQTGSAPKFDVVSMKPCVPEPVAPGARSGGGGNGSFSPGRAYLSCFIVKNLVTEAYISNRGARADPDKNSADPIYNWPGLLGRDLGGPEQVRGGPSWVYSDKYTIEATAPGLDPSNGRGPDRGTMLGPMLRSLLQDRFKLKLHEEYEEAPMYALTVAKGGLKIKPMPEGGCVPGTFDTPGVRVSEAVSRGVKPTCGRVNGGPDGSNWRYEHGGQGLGVVAMVLSSDLGIKVLDRTGVKDLFNIMWEYGPDENTPGVARFFEMTGRTAAGPPTAANMFTALEQQLGLKLEKIKGQRGYLVIDHIERPTPDAPGAVLQRPARAQGAGR